ncbi:DUF3883 domain-containing protein [Glutamicibacter ardleyensis]|uniref:DUF3883 domain-containing protein n=1 Tax=Glutamicibacter ardleyensis TaxID=225894 RepID=UPI003FCF199E
MNASIIGSPWSNEENDATVDSYFELFLNDLQGQFINKSARYLELANLFGRSRTAYELKMRNISAVLVRLGWPYLRGLQPMDNYQGSLEIAVAEYIATRNRTDFEILELPHTIEYLPKSMDLAIHPVPVLVKGGLLEPTHKSVRAAKRDFAALEAASASLGLAGELVVAENEARSLYLAGHKRLSNRVEHVSQTQGDGLGYDILSFDRSGKERLIEVKTSRYAASTPFFITKNEVEVAEQNPLNYWIYRLYDFHSPNSRKYASAPLYQIHGDLSEKLELTPAVYRAIPA